MAVTFAQKLFGSDLKIFFTICVFFIIISTNINFFPSVFLIYFLSFL